MHQAAYSCTDHGTSGSGVAPKPGRSGTMSALPRLQAVKDRGEQLGRHTPPMEQEQRPSGAANFHARTRGCSLVTSVMLARSPALAGVQPGLPVSSHVSIDAWSPRSSRWRSVAIATRRYEQCRRNVMPDASQR